ncbi:glycosyltransferase [Niastella populi]|uniref:Glycosyltransferase n=1 Tax=Niastella populi TaxID=550983 RepID=A0A1V9GD30_9BACT|nr:glycosyltransferase [Niastella populi]OQP68585.1 glycosyltransferase [Niastella populi]
METEDILLLAEPVVITRAEMPALNLKHLQKLTDNTGIIQHALFDIPNRKEGYCIDDNARALLWAVWACKNKKDQTAALMLPVYLSFIHYMQTDDGFFRNFLSYSRTSTEERGSEDSFGRTIMALGYLINEGPSNALVRTGQEIFSKAYPHVNELTSIRGIANTIIGICQFIKYHYPDDRKRNMVTGMSDKMTRMYKNNKNGDWHWFEPVLTYDNAILPLALLNAYEVTQKEEYLTIALESMHFLESKVFYNDILRPIGNDGWCSQDGHIAQFDQQGIDAMAMVLYYQQAYRLTGDPIYLSRMYKSYRWFLGDNDKGLSLYDFSTGGCADGLHSEGINLNQGAESTLAYWLSHEVVASTL